MHDADVARERLFTMRMNEDETARLEALAAHYALNVAGVIRMLAKRDVDALGLKVGETKPAKRSKK